MTISIFEVFYI